MRRYLVLLTICSCFACSKRVPVASRTPSNGVSAIPASELRGLATWYAEPYHGRRTASGEVFDSYGELTAAHRTLPFNTLVKVTNENNGREVEVRINDRGPFSDGRIIDLSLKAARQIDIVRAGVAPVTLTVIREGVPPAPREAPSAATQYTIQVAAFESQDAAETLRNELEQRYPDVTIQKFSGNRTFYRVRVGRLADLASAEKLAGQLRETERFDPFVVRLN